MITSLNDDGATNSANAGFSFIFTILLCLFNALGRLRTKHDDRIHGDRNKR